MSGLRLPCSEAVVVCVSKSTCSSMPVSSATRESCSSPQLPCLFVEVMAAASLRASSATFSERSLLVLREPLSSLLVRVSSSSWLLKGANFCSAMPMNCSRLCVSWFCAALANASRIRFSSSANDALVSSRLRCAAALSASARATAASAVAARPKAFSRSAWREAVSCVRRVSVALSRALVPASSCCKVTSAWFWGWMRRPRR